MTSYVLDDRDVRTQSINEPIGKEPGLHEILGSMVHNKPKYSWSAQIVPKGIAFILCYLAHIEYLRHNFQYDVAFTIVVFADYACNRDDFYIIEYIKEIPSSPRQEEVVFIGNTPVKRYQIECLFKLEAQVYDEVITS
jgi:hypothetical protein